MMQPATDQPDSEHAPRARWEIAVLLLVGLASGFAVGGLLGGLLGAPLGGWLLKSAEPGAGVISGVKNGFIILGALGGLAGLVWGARSRFNPQTRRKLRRFYAIKRGYVSFVLLIAAFAISLIGEVFVNNRALLVSYEGKLFCPVSPFSRAYTGKEFGLEKDRAGQDYTFEVNYRELADNFSKNKSGNWVLMPLVPFNEYENDFREGLVHPSKPNVEMQHYLGTDRTGRDVLARLFYGFRITMIFALVFMLMVYLIGVVIGCLMGYFGGWVDLAGQRAVEVWQNIPFLYMVIIVVAAVSDLPFTLPAWFKILVLLAIMVVFSWTSMTYYMRTAVYREKARDYVAAAELLGASTPRILFNHLLPNTISTMVTFMPFTVATAIISITALDYLNFGLPKPTPSWGELLQQGVANLHAPWIVLSAFGAMVLVLTLVTFIGEGVREAFDPKKFTTYE
jgi:microcin C transport system permease protein